MSDVPNEIQDWLRRLAWSLATIPSPEREDIVAETRAHLLEAVAGGKSPAQALDGFDTPEEYARQFVDEMDVSRALGSGRPTAMFGTIARRMHRSAWALGAFVVVLLVAAFGAGVAYTAVMKIVDPEHAGLWVGNGNAIFFIGMIDDTSRAHEVLGYGLFPFAAVAIVLCWLGCRLVLTRTLKFLARTR